MSRRFSDAIPAFSTPGAEKILNIVGNHDALGDDTGWDWSKRVSDEELYNMIFKPFCANWDVAIIKNTTYWYKDYATFNLRLIGIDSTLGGNSLQISWLKDTLFSAKSLGYSVVIATHYPPENRIKVPCGFTSLINDYQGSGLFGAMDEQIQIIVQDFIDCGGEFVCYLSGHTHTDYIWFNKNFPEQLCITVDSANAFHSNLFGDTYRVADTKSEDLFNLFSFDPKLKIVKIVRIGANANSILQLKNAIAINYKTMEVL